MTNNIQLLYLQVHFKNSETLRNANILNIYVSFIKKVLIFSSYGSVMSVRYGDDKYGTRTSNWELNPEQESWKPVC